MGLERITAETPRWLNESKEDGYLTLVNILRVETDVEKIKRIAAFLQEKSDAGDPTAQLALGACLCGGIGVAMDESKGRTWIQRAADQNHPAARALLDTL